MSDKFAVGDRVTRQSDWHEPLVLRHGTIEARYHQSRKFTGLGTYTDHELYAVKWDDTGLVERGYFPHGLERETTVIA